MKMFFDPPRTRGITVQDRHGRPLTGEEILDLANRRVKWTRREDGRLAVMLEGPVKGEEGVLVYFPHPSEFEVAARRVFPAAAAAEAE